MFKRIREVAALIRSYNLNQIRQFIYGPPTIAGVSVSEEIALGISAVYRAVTLIASTVAGLDVEVYKVVPGQGRLTQIMSRVAMLLRDPNDELNAFKFWRAIILQCVCSGNGYAEIERADDAAGTPIGLHIIHWRNVMMMRAEDGTLFYRLKKEGKDVPARDMLHINMISWDGLLGISPITAGRETLGICISAERYAGSVFGKGGVPRGFLKVAGKPTPETKGAIREAWDVIYGGVENSNQVGLLFAGTEWVNANMTPEDAQLLLSRAFQIEEVARLFGVPVNLLFSSNQSSYNSNEESNIQFYQLGLRALLKNLEAEMDHKLFSRDERFDGFHVKYKVESLLRGNFRATADAWSGLVLKGICTPNEARDALGLNPKDGGDELLRPSNLVTATGGDGQEKTTAGYAMPAGKANGHPIDDILAKAA